MTIDQFAEWVQATFPDNTTRSISESDFRDGLIEMAKFVFDTNSSTYVQERIAEMNLIKQDTEAAAAEADQIKQDTAQVLILTQGERSLAEQYKDQTLQIKQEADTNATLARVFQATVNLATNTPNLSALTLNNTTDKGKFWKVAPGGGGTTTITGTSVEAHEGDEFTWNGTGFYWTVNQVYDESITRAKLEPDLQKSTMGLVDVVNDQFPVVMNEITKRMTLWYDSEGNLFGKFDLSRSDIPFENLPDSVKEGLIGSVDLGYSENIPIWMMNGDYMGIYGNRNGEVYIPKLKLPGKSITENQLADSVTGKLPSDAFKRIADTNFYDVETGDDELVRGVEIEIPIKTATDSGFAFQQFPSVKTKVIKGLNDTGFDLLFRQTCGMPIRGRYYRGTFNPNASGFNGTKLVGRYGNSYTNVYPAFPAGNDGDCWIIDAGNTNVTKTANGKTFKNGDFLVLQGGVHQIQSGPGNGTFGTSPGEFWDISEAGYFGGIYYPAGSRIYVLGMESQSGPRYMKYAVSKPGELFTMGECTAGFAPASQRDGDLYIFSADATVQGLAGKTGDFLIYRGGWGLAAGQIISVPNGKSFFLPCQNANEWSVRRADKSVASVTVTAYGQRTTVRRKSKDFLALFSDSMFSNSVGVGSKILAKTGRQGVVKSYGGGTSYDILAMYKDYIFSGDPNPGAVNVIWHGANNPLDMVQLKDAAYRFAALIGANESRFIFWSILGARTVTWTGTRLAAVQQEEAFSKVGPVYVSEKFYETAFPRQYYSPRLGLLAKGASRTTTPDLLNPGKTEAQSTVYDPANGTYGVVPFSYFFDFTGKPFTAQNVTFTGYHTANGMPTGGNPLDYKIRVSGAGVTYSAPGTLIVNIAGTWTEYTWDSIHLSPEGQDAASTDFTDSLTLRNI